MNTQETEQEEPTQILKDYKPIIEDNYTYYCYYGGRGGGKTENIALMLVLAAVQNKDYRILCIRELEISVKESVRQAIIDAIERLGLFEVFKIGLSEITCYATNSKFLFSGMNEIYARKIKSIKRINITWVEEASDISEVTWLTLIPSVLREKDSKIIVSFNPLSPENIVYKIFIKNTPPENTFIKKVCYYDNPFFKNSNLEKQRLHQLSILPIQIYNHIWEGDILQIISNALWKHEDIENSMAECPNYKDFVSIVIACDPATTNKDFSNEYGVIALGKTKGGIIYVLKDYSASMSPSLFAEIVDNAVKEWKAYCDDVKVVVETNQGGDFIKHSLLTLNPFFNIIEVRAGYDKVQRATPVVNLFSMGKVFIEKSQDFSNLKRQMKLLTFNGFLGSKGESPDRLDAMVWGVYYLADIENIETQETFYKPYYFIHNKDFSFVESWNNIIGYIDGDSIYMLVYNIVSNSNTEKRFLITDSLICTSKNILETIAELKPNSVMMPNNALTYNVNMGEIQINLYDTINQSLDEFAQSMLNIVSSNKIMFKETMPVRYNGLEKGQLVKMQTILYKEKSKKSFSFIWLINYLLKEIAI